MARVTIDCDEAYPDYFMVELVPSLSVEVDAKTIARWKRISKQYAAIQEEMAKAHEEQDQNWRKAREAERTGR